jgi:Holliday junction resolvase RusA-like endonuclease
MKEVVFEVLGKVQAKGRVRFSNRGGYVKTYTPENTINYENWVKTCLIQAVGNKYSTYAGAVKIELKAVYAPPKSYSKKKTKMLLETEAPYLNKPDCDNIAKIVCDALNGIAYKDDSQIFDVKISKVYGVDEKLIVKISYLED